MFMIMRNANAVRNASCHCSLHRRDESKGMKGASKQWRRIDQQSFVKQRYTSTISSYLLYSGYHLYCCSKERLPNTIIACSMHSNCRSVAHHRLRHAGHWVICHLFHWGVLLRMTPIWGRERLLLFSSTSLTRQHTDRSLTFPNLRRGIENEGKIQSWIRWSVCSLKLMDVFFRPVRIVLPTVLKSQIMQIHVPWLILYIQIDNAVFGQQQKLSKTFSDALCQALIKEVSPLRRQARLQPRKPPMNLSTWLKSCQLQSHSIKMCTSSQRLNGFLMMNTTQRLNGFLMMKTRLSINRNRSTIVPTRILTTLHPITRNLRQVLGSDHD